LKQIYEILVEVADAPKRVDKMKVLVDNDCIALRDLMKVNFDPNLTLYVSKKIDYKPAGLVSHKSSLQLMTKFLVPLASETYLTSMRRDEIFKDILEKLHPQEAHILVEAKNKKLKVKGLTLKLIEGVWGKRIFN
jgi:hypothetical protein